MKYVHHIYRVTAPGQETESALGYDTIGGALWFTSRREAERCVSRCAQAWIDNPPGFFGDEERDEYMAQDFKAQYRIDRMSLYDALEELSYVDDDDASRLAQQLGDRYPAGREVPKPGDLGYRYVDGKLTPIEGEPKRYPDYQ